jgi:hypothetical protein
MRCPAPATQLCVTSRRADLVDDTIGGCARIGGAQDGTPDHEIIGAESNRVGRCRVPLLVVRRCACRPDAGADDQRRTREGLAAPSNGVAGRDDAVAPRGDGARGALDDVALEIGVGASHLGEVGCVEAREKRHRQELQLRRGVRVPRRDGRADGWSGHRFAEREELDAACDARVDDAADGVADIARHLEVDEDALAAQRLQERRYAARHEELKADLEERHVVERRHRAQGIIDCGHVERHNQAIGGGHVRRDRARASSGVRQFGSKRRRSHAVMIQEFIRRH